MNLIARLLAALIGFLLGVALTIFSVGRYVDATYPCRLGMTEPCDAGGLVGMGLVVVWAPVVGLLCASAGYWLTARRQSRHPA